MYCQSCGCDAPTRYVSFHQNIGALVMRFYEGIEGNLCKSCIHGYFWKYTGVNMFLGWWGYISLVITPFFMINNVFYYVPCLFMEAPDPNAAAPELTERDVQYLSPFTNMIINRLNAGEPLETVAPDVAAQSGTTTAKVFLYVRALAEQANQQA
jgi:hypothetical protein